MLSYRQKLKRDMQWLRIRQTCSRPTAPSKETWPTIKQFKRVAVASEIRREIVFAPRGRSLISYLADPNSIRKLLMYPNSKNIIRTFRNGIIIVEAVTVWASSNHHRQKCSTKESVPALLRRSIRHQLSRRASLSG